MSIRDYVVEAFAVVVIGGLGSVPGAMLGALLVGMLDAFGILIMPAVSNGLHLYGHGSGAGLSPAGTLWRAGDPRMSEPVYRYLGARAALRRAMVGGVIAAAGLALVPAVVSPFQILFATEMLIQCLFALAFNLLFGITGLLSFGQAAYFGVGGYLAALALVHGWTGILGVLLLSTVGAALAGLVLGYCCVRLNEIYFAMLTLAFGQMLYAGAWQWAEVTGERWHPRGATAPATAAGTDSATRYRPGFLCPGGHCRPPGHAVPVGGRHVAVWADATGHPGKA